MERSEYLKMCQQCAILPNGVAGIKQNVPDELIVKHNNIPYYPLSYELSFDNKGNAQHNAILHSLVAHSIVKVNLSKVKECNEGG